jgi:hypothetical protein
MTEFLICVLVPDVTNVSSPEAHFLQFKSSGAQMKDEISEAYSAVTSRTKPILKKELIVCDSCSFSFNAEETGCELCLTCLKVLRCMQFVAEHRLCSCGDSWCIHNDEARQEKADKLARLAKHTIQT